MRAPISWLKEYAALSAAVTPRQIYDAAIRAGLEVETIDHVGPHASGPVVVGRVLSFVEEPQKNGKVIRWCRVDCGEEHNASASEPAAPGEPGSRGIVCGAHNFAVGDLVVVGLPGAVLAGGFALTSRKTYGHISDGMICAEDELGIGEDHGGILVLPPADDQGSPITPGQEALPLVAVSDDVLDIAVTPDLGYCLSIRGLARELAQAFGVDFLDPAALTTPAPKEEGQPVRLDTPGCPLFVAVTVRGIDPSRPTPAWLAARLKQCGVRSLGLAIDITNYVMLEIGQPIHGYDGDLLSGPIVVRQAAVGERLTTLDGVSRRLDPTDLVISDDSGAIGLAGVMGGQTTELSPATTTVVIEAAHFDPVAIGQTAKRHKLPSEASRRFERTVDPSAAYAAAHRVAELLVSLAGGRLDPGETVAGGLPPAESLTIEAGLPGRILGHPVPPDQVTSILRASGVRVEAEGSELTLTPPSWRPDLRDPYDYVEEVGKKIGYDLVEPVVPLAPAGRGRTKSQQARQALNWTLPAAGFTEVISFPFASPEDADKLGLLPDDTRRQYVLLANPLADTQPAMRTSLLPGLFAAVARNRSRSLDDLALYEQGLVFFGPAGVAPIPSVLGRPSEAELAAIAAGLPRQPRHLACVISGNWLPANWSTPAVPASWTQAIAFAETAARSVGLTLTRRPADQAPWHPGRCAELSVAGQVVGYAGELHPSVCQAYGLPERLAAAELDLDALIAAAPAAGMLPPLSSYPVAKEDVALIVDEEVPQAAVAQALREGAGELLESLALFDVYRSETIGEGKKSLAFALRFRASDRTLTDAEAAAARDSAVARAAELYGAIQRIA